MLTPDWVRGRTMAAFVLAVFGILPIGSLAAGALGDSVGADTALVIFSGGVVLVGLVAMRMNLPIAENIVPPVMAQSAQAPGQRPPSLEGPLMVVTTWTIESSEEMEEFGAVLAELRRLRLATGAYRWNAYRTVDEPEQVLETYVVHSWEHHIQLENRLDTRGKEIIDRAKRFGSPERHVTSHFAELSVMSSEVKRHDP